MAVFESRHFDGHEQVVFCHDKASGLKAIIAIHNTNIGPSLGGCRMWDYASDEDALADVLRLSRGMTYKNALANLPWGGGKSVIIGNSHTGKNPEMFQALGRFVESLSGRYIIAEDVGTSPSDMDEINKFTDHVHGISRFDGDPSPGTAFGVFKGIEAAVQERLGKNALHGVRVAVQGLGHVGFDVARQLKEAGAEIVVTDIYPEAIERARKELGATVVEPDAIYDANVDVYAPCALGATVNDNTLPRIKAAIVAGAANNQLAEARHGVALKEKNILYAPDYVINAGGVIHVYHQGPEFDREKVFAHIAGISDTLHEIFKRAKGEDITPEQAADRIAEEKFTKKAA